MTKQTERKKWLIGQSHLCKKSIQYRDINRQKCRYIILNKVSLSLSKDVWKITNQNNTNPKGILLQAWEVCPKTYTRTAFPSASSLLHLMEMENGVFYLLCEIYSLFYTAAETQILASQRCPHSLFLQLPSGRTRTRNQLLLTPRPGKPRPHAATQKCHTVQFSCHLMFP